MRTVFEQYIGPTKLVAEAFGGLGLLAEDRSYVSKTAKLLINVSLLMKALSSVAAPLIWLADSVYVVSVKRQDAVTQAAPSIQRRTGWG